MLHTQVQRYARSGSCSVRSLSATLGITRGQNRNAAHPGEIGLHGASKMQRYIQSTSSAFPLRLCVSAREWSWGCRAIPGGSF